MGSGAAPGAVRSRRLLPGRERQRAVRRREPGAQPAGRCGAEAGVTALLGMAAAVGAVARRPRLWPVAVRQWRRTTPPGWWRRRPFLPVPSGEYLRFRLLTQYGDSETRASGA